jgi:L-ascorbate metabolism protein UlaG (beta-lactamase superfamily)
MELSMKEKTILGSCAALVIVAVVLQYVWNPFAPASTLSGVVGPEGINVTLLTNAGIMIEADGVRIYIDPIDLPQEYREKPADAILITHDHGDHYQYSTINMLQKEDTLNVFPAIMDTEIARHDGMGVVPEDEFNIGDIRVTAYYMYTYSPDGSMAASHPRESQYTSYIVDIDGFTIFHAGDSKNLDEYTELTGTISVACLPLGPGCQTMCDSELVDVVSVIQPDYMIPIHYTQDSYRSFNSVYKRSIESNECTVCSLENFSTHTFTTG